MDKKKNNKQNTTKRRAQKKSKINESLGKLFYGGNRNKSHK